MTLPRTLFDKLWQAHTVTELAPGTALLHVDRHFIHDLQSSAFARLAERKLPVRNPELTVCVADHTVSSLPQRTGGANEWSNKHVIQLRESSRALSIPLIDANDRSQGIIHVIGPELGLTQPGMLIACGDSHTSTHGAFGALALGIGSTEIVHVLATQTVCVRKPLSMRIVINGLMHPGVETKDVILALISKYGTASATGYAIEYAGEAVRNMDMEERMTLCNLSIEMGANFGMVGPDETTFKFLAGTPNAPQGVMWDRALAQWRILPSDPGSVFDHEIHFNAAEVRPQISWGTSPEQTMELDGTLPNPEQVALDQREPLEAALNYMGLIGGERLAGTQIDHVFIGSCANGRLSDLRRAAQVVRGSRLAPHTTAWVVPGSQAVKRAAETEGLHEVFLTAGFEWREPGCSMCVGANGEVLLPGQRCVSTSNRNFVGRQGPGVRTHLAGVSVAAQAALLGHIPSTSEMNARVN